MDFYRPPEDSPEMKYIQKRTQVMGSLPVRRAKQAEFKAPGLDLLAESVAGSQGREVSTTMAYVRILTLLLKDHAISKYIVPIVPDEARTFGMESLFRQIGIYASQGQLYSPVDSNMFLYYKEAKDGQILEEGITEAGAMASFTAAGTSYATYGVPMIPFFSYYSMFGFQRIGDLIWAFADSRGKGFLMGGTAGRTTLSGEGLQHCDGHSVVLSSVVPTCHTYDPAYAYEMAVDHPGRHPPDVRGDGGSLLLHHDVQRELRSAGRCRKVSRKGSFAVFIVASRPRAAKRRSTFSAAARF